MKEISQQSLHSIRDIIQGQNYANIKARLDQLLPREYASMFAKVNFSGTRGFWFGNDETDYLPYAETGNTEKEEIAQVLEDCRTFSCERLRGEMPFIEKVFSIPSTDQIWWYRDCNGQIRVLLTQWGFQKRQLDAHADIIDMLIGAPRTLTREEVTIWFHYPNGEGVAEHKFTIHIFNNVKECTTNNEGRFHAGKLNTGTIFSVADPNGSDKVDFTVDGRETYEIIIKREEVPDHPEPPIPPTPPEPPTPPSPPAPPVSVKNIVFKLYDLDGSPLPLTSFKITSKGMPDIMCQTDEKGEAHISEDKLKNRTRYKIRLSISPEERAELDRNKNK